MMKILGLLGGRKFVVALFGVIAIALQNSLGINPDSVNALGAIIATYVLGQGIADGLSHGATSSTVEQDKNPS